VQWPSSSVMQAPVYKSTTTTPRYDELTNARHSSFGCCRGRKRRLQAAALFGGAVALATGGALAGVAAASNASGGAFALLFVLALGLICAGVGLVIQHLRSTGRVNLPCWPNRAAVLSRNLVLREEDEMARPARSATEVRLL